MTSEVQKEHYAMSVDEIVRILRPTAEERAARTAARHNRKRVLAESAPEPDHIERVNRPSR